MGREIVYCDRCARRLTGDDFDRGAAVRREYRAVCAACAEETSGPEAPGREPDRPLPAASREAPPPPPPARRGLRNPLGWSAGAAAVLALLGMAGYASLHRRPTEPKASAAAPEVPRVQDGIERRSERDVAAAADLERAREYGRAQPGDLSGRIDRLTGVALTWDGTPAGRDAQAEAAACRVQFRDWIERELAGADQDVEALLGGESFGRTFERLKLVRSRHPFPAWSFEVDRRIQRVEARGRALLTELIGAARLARRSGSEEEFSKIRGRILSWGWPESLSEFDRSSPPPAVRPAVVSAEGRSYQEQWELSWIHASWGDFDGAEQRLRKIADSLREDRWIKEARQDLEDLAIMASLHRTLIPLLASCTRDEPLDLVAGPGSGHPGPVQDPLYRALPEGLWFKKPGERRPYFIGFEEFQCASRLRTAQRKAKGAAPFDPRASALLCLVSGEVAAGRSYASGLGKPIPERAYAFAQGKLPFSEGSASAVARQDLAACRLFYDADWDFCSVATRGDAVLKYRELREDYAAAKVVVRNRELIRRRCEAGQDQVFRAGDLRATGTFELTSWKSRNETLDACLLSRDDVDARDSQNNYVEIQFCALPDTRYRCWVYAGACCLESFTCYFQTTGFTTVDPDTKQSLSLEPGGNFALPLKPGIFLRSTHAAHARRDVPKKPARWTWMEVPLGVYEKGGLKKVRLISDQKGFAVAYAIVSSVREEPPTGPETRALGIAPPRPAPPESPEPRDWLLLGPFQNRGFGASDPPEEDLDLSSEVQTKAGLKRWTLEVAPLRPAGDGKAAVLDFTGHFTPAENVVAFALIHAWVPEETDAVLLLGSDDGVKVWLNEDLVHALDRGRGVTIDEDRAEIRLQAGWNRFLVKVYQGKGGWGLAFRLADRLGKPLPGLRYDPYGDLPGIARDP